MSSLDLSRVLSQCEKGLKAVYGGLYARAEQCFSAAVEEARAAQPPADDLVFATLLVYDADATSKHAKMPGVSPAEHAELLQRAVPLLVEATRALRSRAAAGSLMGEGLRAAEADFFSALTVIIHKLLVASHDSPPASSLAMLTGYNAYMMAADCALWVAKERKTAMTGSLSSPEFVERFQSLEELRASVAVAVEFAASALDLMADPQMQSNPVSADAALLFTMQELEHSGYFPS